MKGVNTKEFKSKLLISSIRLLIPTFDKSFYLNIIVNDDKTYKTKTLDFKKSNTIDLNQVFELEGVTHLESIRFQIYEKTTIFSNALFKGEMTKYNKIKADHSNQLICFLSNNNQENCVVVYYNYELNPDLLDTFDHNLKILEEEQKSKVLQSPKSSLANLMDLAKGDNAENFTKFVHNMEYVKTIEIAVDEFINWSNPWKTLSLLFIVTYSLLYWKLIFIFSPLIVIYFHLYNRDKMVTYSHKTTKHDNLANMKLITKSIELTNKVVDSYENFLEAMQYSDKKIYEEIYVNLLKLIILNVFVIYFGLVRINMLIIISIWAFILLRNPSFQAFVIFLFNFIYKKFFSKLDNIPKLNKFTRVVETTIFTVVPFAEIIRKVLKIKKEIMINSTRDTKNKYASNDLKLKDVLENLQDKTVLLSTDISNASVPLSGDTGEYLKFEIYENERWWMFVGWSKNLIMNERPLWSDVAGKTYMDKNSVFLPNENYQWVGDWKVESTSTCDDQGWEYSNDFNSTYESRSTGKYVRRRKWVRYAKKI
jgi:hypothetical protein